MTNPFYSSEQTELSRGVLGEIVAAVPGAILIGEWGTWVRTRGPVSHDVDLIIGRSELAVLEGLVDDLSTSHHLAGTRWRATWRSIHLDLYVPHQSRLGANLQLRTEALVAYQEQVGAYRVLSAAAHTATKMAALLDRPDSLPGRKDRDEILRLLAQPGTAATPGIMAAASTRPPDQQRVLVGKAFEFLVAEPSLSRAGRDRLRRMGTAWQGSIGTEPQQSGPDPEAGPSMGP